MTRGRVGGRLLALALTAMTAVPLAIVRAAPAGAAVAIERLAGADRYATAIVVSQRGWGGGAPAVIVAGGADWRDAIAASGLAGALGRVPVLLTPPEALRDDVRAEVVRLKPSRAFVIGGAAAVSPAVVDALSAVVPSVQRLAGADAAATAADVATDGFNGALPASARSSAFVISTGDPDSGIAAGAIAAARGVPVLLTLPDRVPQATLDALHQLGATTVYAVGAPSALSDAVVASIPGGRRVGEADSIATSVAVAQLAAGWGFNVRHALLASAWADGVPAASLAAAYNAPLLVTHGVGWHGRLADWYRITVPTGTTIVGGDGAVDPFVVAGIADGGLGLVRGQNSTGALVSLIQQRLAESGFHPGPVTGQFNFQTKVAVWALEKAFGFPIDGVVADTELAPLRDRTHAPVLRPDITAQVGDHVEVSLSRQLVQVVRGGRVQAAVHTSTGKPSTPTIQGLFRILDHRPGFNAERMYMTMHFSGGYAIHGYDPVPTYPASHGCARVTYADAEFLYAMVPNGMPVIVWR